MIVAINSEDDINIEVNKLHDIVYALEHAKSNERYDVAVDLESGVTKTYDSWNALVADEELGSESIVSVSTEYDLDNLIEKLNNLLITMESEKGVSYHWLIDYEEGKLNTYPSEKALNNRECSHDDKSNEGYINE